MLALAKKCPSYGDGTDESLEISEKLNSDLYKITRGLPTLFGGEYNIGYYMYTEVVSWGKKSKLPQTADTTDTIFRTGLLLPVCTR